ncbi:hypothetical protein DMENIID0001_038430 [Sergentomyia squamirostris]
MVDKKVFMLIVITFSVVVSLSTVKAHYIPDGEHESSEEDYSREEPSKVSEFFENIKCGISHGAKKIRDGVVSGYDYIKDKISPKSKPEVVIAEVPANVSEVIPTMSTKLAPMPAVPTVPVVPADQPITIPTSTTDIPPPVWDFALIDVRAMINDTDDTFGGDNIISTSTPNITLDNRNLFDAPSYCKDGELKDRTGRCRKVA